MKCTSCGLTNELRMGICWNCANEGETRSAKRTSWQHFCKALYNISHWEWQFAWYDLCWCYERLTETGDYAKDGYFDSQGIDWRAP